MKVRRLNRKAFITKYLICLAVMIALTAGYWVRTRSTRADRARRAAAQVAQYIQARIDDMGRYSDVMAAWLDAEGDSVKKAISASADGEEHRSEFEKMAGALYDESIMSSIQLLPSASVKYIYPVEGNEDLSGTSKEGQWDEELAEAGSDGGMCILGPEFISKHGLVLGFYMPVYYDNGSLWGYTSTTMRLPDALMPLTLERLTEQGYDYVLKYVVDKDTGKTDRIAGSVQGMSDSADSVFEIQGREWILSVRPEEGWISIGGIFLSVLISLIGALLLAWILESRKANRDEAMSQLRSDAKHDKMTGLLNHTASAEAIDNALQTVEGGVLLLIDIDNFKTVNDTAGHLAGDEVLVEVANAMRTTFRKYDLLGRYGGDEFIVYMIGDISIPDFSVKASQFQRKIRKIPVGNTGTYVTCSIGGARRCAETPTAETLVQRADQALYTSKGNGKDRFTIYDDSGSTVIVTPNKDDSELDHDYSVSE